MQRLENLSIALFGPEGWSIFQCQEEILQVVLDSLPQSLQNLELDLVPSYYPTTSEVTFVRHWAS
jgi:hypothetical protein